ncbi:MAG: hypothetical protein L0Z55_04670 [Planctomycetes bacterium]|nr:hypothetical protein [Planctomycetota bacterium]
MIRRRAVAASAALAFFLAGAATLSAQQEPSQEELAQRRTKKLEAQFLKSAAWSTDYDAALKLAKESGKLVFAYFTRSYNP